MSLQIKVPNGFMAHKPVSLRELAKNSSLLCWEQLSGKRKEKLHFLFRVMRVHGAVLFSVLPLLSSL